MFKGVISFPLACRVVIFSLSAVIEMKKVGWGVLDSLVEIPSIQREFSGMIWMGHVDSDGSEIGG